MPLVDFSNHKIYSRQDLSQSVQLREDLNFNQDFEKLCAVVGALKQAW